MITLPLTPINAKTIAEIKSAQKALEEKEQLFINTFLGANNIDPADVAPNGFIISGDYKGIIVKLKEAKGEEENASSTN